MLDASAAMHMVNNIAESISSPSVSSWHEGLWAQIVGPYHRDGTIGSS
jgi:hypothetical protein